MPDFNAGLLQIGDLGTQLQQSRKNKQEDQQNLLNGFNSLADQYVQGQDKSALDAALANNFDPTTGTLNQQGVVAELYKYKPQLAQQLSQQYMDKGLANQKTQSELAKMTAETGKIGAEAGKLGAETSGLDFKQQQEKVSQGLKFLNAANSQESYNKALDWGRSNQLGHVVDMLPKEYNAANKPQIAAMALDFQDQLKNGIDQQNANAGTMNALTNQQKANQDYEINTNKNSIDQQKAQADIAKIQNDIATKGMITPEQQIQLQKAQNDLQSNKMESSNKIQDKVAGLNYTNQLVSTFDGNAKRLLDMDLFTAGKDPATGDYLRDKSGKIIPADSNQGGLWATGARKLDPGTNKYKEAAKEYDTLVGVAKGKTMAEFKTAIGSPGPVTDSDAKNFAAMQGLPESFEDFVRKPAQEQVDALDKIRQAAKSSLETNNKLIKKYTSQESDISQQQINAPAPRNQLQIQQAQAPNQLQNAQGLPIALPNTQQGTIPPLRNQVYKAPNGFVLTPAMFDKIEAAKKQGK